MITDRAAVKAGAKLTRVYKGKRYDCDVVKTKDGLRFVHAGVEYKSISGPSCFIMKSRGGTGWQFWSLANHTTGKTPKTPAKKQPAKKTNAQLATDKEMAAEVALAGGKKKVAAAVKATAPKSKRAAKASTKEVA